MNKPENLDESRRVKRVGRGLVVLAGLLWSTSGFFARAPYFYGWPGPVLAFWRAVFACIILIPLVRRIGWSWMMIPMAFAFALMNYTYLTAMMRGSPANAIWLQSTAPVWVLILGVFVFGETSHLRDWLLILFCMVGIGVILFYESRGESFDAVLYGLASGVLYGCVVLSLRQLRGFDSAWLATLNHIVTALALVPFMLLSKDQFWPSGIQWPLLAGFGMLQMGLPYMIFGLSLRYIPGHEAAGIGMIEPLLVPVWVFVAWGEVPAWWTLLGGGFILLGLLIRYLSEAQQRRQWAVNQT